MSGYAIDVVGAWRCVDSAADLVAGETFSAAIPPSQPSPIYVWATTQWTLPLSNYKAAKVAAIKTEAGRRITAQYPLATGKQSNMLARMAELINKRLSGGTLTAGEQAEQDTLDAAWAWVKSIRTAEGITTAAILAAVDIAAVDTAVAAVAWPQTTPPTWGS